MVWVGPRCREPSWQARIQCPQVVLASVALHVVLLVRCDLAHAGTEHDADPILDSTFSHAVG